jgi:tRNA threonylcarbamoyl adenosine modification protein YeaZ
MELAIDCAADEVGLALAVDGVAGLTLMWQTERNHSVELLPNIERLLAEAERTRADIDAVFVDVGPGGYAALRVGVSTAKAMAHALGVLLVGVGRLELDAHAVLEDAGGRTIVAVHRAGRGEFAWARYKPGADGVRELSPPALAKVPALVVALEAGDALTGDVDETLAAAVDERFGADQRGRTLEGDGSVSPARMLTPRHHRVVSLAALGHARLAAGRTNDPTALVPLYLRAPAIGPQG